MAAPTSLVTSYAADDPLSRLAYCTVDWRIRWRRPVAILEELHRYRIERSIKLRQDTCRTPQPLHPCRL